MLRGHWARDQTVECPAANGPLGCVTASFEKLADSVECCYIQLLLLQPSVPHFLLQSPFSHLPLKPIHRNTAEFGIMITSWLTLRLGPNELPLPSLADAPDPGLKGCCISSSTAELEAALAEGCLLWSKLSDNDVTIGIQNSIWEAIGKEDLVSKVPPLLVKKEDKSISNREFKATSFSVILLRFKLKLFHK